MEFDPEVQTRWRASLLCFLAALAVFFIARLDVGLGYWRMHWIFASVPSLAGVALAIFSIAAREPRRLVAVGALLLNLYFPGTLLVSFLSFYFPGR